MQETNDFDNDMYIFWLWPSHGCMDLLIPQVL